MILRDALGVTLVSTLIVISLYISDAFAVNQTEIKEVRETTNLLFENPFAAITIVGVLSLVISLIVFSASWRLRDKKSQNDMEMGKITDNLEKVKGILGEPAFTNLLNGLSSAAKEEIVFPEPVGVLRHKEFRRALTISVTLTYFTLLGFSASDPTAAQTLNDNPVIQSFAWVFVAVIAFYFGDKIFENYVKSKGVQVTKTLEPITIKEAKISKDGKKLTVTIRNNLKSKIKVTKIDVDGETPKGFKEFEIEGEKSESKEISVEKVGKTIKAEAGPVTAKKEIEAEENKVK
ncbi:MAG: hypothetical protein ACREAF_02180 [Nitrosopumilaceae archaeon]